MSVDEDNTEEWKTQGKNKKKRKNAAKPDELCYQCDKCDMKFKTDHALIDHKKTNHREDPGYNCENCQLIFKTKADLLEHKKTNHREDPGYNCEICQLILKTKDDLLEHVRSTHDKKLCFKCKKCETNLKSEEELKHHMVTLHEEKSFKCDKCDKAYISMGKLRRHDWRCHREVDCNICGKQINCRQDIKNHRGEEHKMFHKVYCKYFPRCMDEDECLFEHGSDSNEMDTNERLFCSNGEKCTDQSCNFSEQSHHAQVRVVCKFQSNCNRLNCPFKHTMARKAFLEVGSISNKRN
jgi:general transcription factor IIIA